MVEALRAAGLPLPVRQHLVALADGAAVKLDLAYPGQKVSVEGRGFAPHGGRRAFEADMERTNALVAAGWAPIETGGER